MSQTHETTTWCDGPGTASGGCDNWTNELAPTRKLDGWTTCHVRYTAEGERAGAPWGRVDHCPTCSAIFGPPSEDSITDLPRVSQRRNNP
jgi:hypothetical protein